MKNLVITLTAIITLASSVSASSTPAPLELEPLSTDLKLISGPIQIEGFSPSVKADIFLDNVSSEQALDTSSTEEAPAMASAAVKLTELEIL